VLPRRTRGICGSAPGARTCGKRWPGAGRSVPARVGSTSAARQGRPGRSRPASRAAADRSPAALATVLAAVIADGHPLRDPHPLSDLPVHPAGTGGVRGRGVPGCRHSGRRVGTGGAAGPGRVVTAVRRVPPATVDRGWGFGAAPHPGNGAVSTGQPVRSGPGWFGDPRGILRMAWSRWRYPGSAEPGSDRLRDEAPTAAVRAPRRADRRAPRSPRGRRRCSGWA